MAAVNTDVFWHLVKGLREVNNAAEDPAEDTAKDPGICSGAGSLKRGKFYHTLTTCKAYAAMCLFYQNYWVHKLTSEKHRQAYKGDLVCSRSWKNLGHNLESSFFFTYIYKTKNMSMKKWRQIAEEKTKLDEQ